MMKLPPFLNKAALCVLPIVFVSCAASTKMTRKSVIEKFEAVGQLDRAVKKGNAEHLSLLAPTSFSRATVALDAAVKLAQNGAETDAEREAKKGLAAVAAARKVAERGRELLSEVMETRARALAADARVLLREDFAKADGTLKEISKLVEEEQLDAAREQRIALIRTYANLELSALKQGTVDAARAAIEAAEESGADDYARQTLKQAKEELKLVVSILDADRTQTDKADTHAKKAKYLAQQAQQITAIAMMFEKEDFSNEQIVLWYQDQLTEVNAPTGDSLPFYEPNAVVVGRLRDTVSSFVSALNDARVLNARNQHNIEQLTTQIEQERTRHEAEMVLAANKRLDELEALSSASRKEIEAIKEAGRKEIEELRATTDAKLTALRQERDIELAKMTAEQERIAATMQGSSEEERAYLATENARQQEELRNAYENKIASMKDGYEGTITEQTKTLEQIKHAREKRDYVASLFGRDEAKVAVNGKDVAINVLGFDFSPGKYEIKSVNFGLLNKVVSAIQAFPDATVQINGHTDSVGSDKVNRALSEKRAISVANFLIDAGKVDSARIAARGLGEDHPMASNDSKDGRALNRRIEILIEPK